MASRSRKKLVAKLTQPEYALLKDLTDAGALDAPFLEASVNEVVGDRLALARAFIRAAKILAMDADALVRRSAVSRAYYAAHHATRATVFAVRRRDEQGHSELARVIDSVLEGRASVGSELKELLRLRQQMDYSPYPGPNEGSQYENEEIERVIHTTVARAEHLMDTLERYLRERK